MAVVVVVVSYCMLRLLSMGHVEYPLVGNGNREEGGGRREGWLSLGHRERSEQESRGEMRRQGMKASAMDNQQELIVGRRVDPTMGIIRSEALRIGGRQTWSKTVRPGAARHLIWRRSCRLLLLDWSTA